MASRTNTIVSGLRAAGLGLLYVLGLAISVLFVIPILLGEQLLPNRSAHHGERYGYSLPSRIGMIASDVVAVVAAYLVGDILRCYLWMKTSWPEYVDGHGLTLHIHLKMMVLVLAVWPLILYWLGWYAERWRSWRWRIRNTLASMVVLALVIAAGSLLVHRDLYPRAQIGFAVAMLPLSTALVRALVQIGRRLGGRATSEGGTGDAEW